MGGKLFSDMLYDVLKDCVTPGLIKNLTVKCVKTQGDIGAIGATLLIMEDEYQVVEEV